MPLGMTGTTPYFGFQAPKRVAVVDDFGAKSVDIDGDAVPDLSHGETVSRIIRGFRRGVEVVPFNLDFEGADTLEDNRNKLATQFQDLFERISAKKERFDAANLSIGSDIAYDEVRFEDGRQLTPGNLAGHSDELVTWAYTSSPYRYKVLEALDGVLRLTKLYLAAGNSGDTHFSFNSVLEGQTTVGATSAKGNKLPYSPTNNLVSRYEQGTFGIVKVADGFDITGDGIADVMNHEVSGGEPVIRQFAGKAYEDVRFTREDFLKLKGALAEGKRFADIDWIYHKLYPLELLKAMFNIPPERVAMRSGGPEFAMFIRAQEQGETEARVKAGFIVDARTGQVIYDPDESGRPEMIHHIWGTSFASTKALALDLDRPDAGDRPTPGQVLDQVA
jgi:hypothetical protein